MDFLDPLLLLDVCKYDDGPIVFGRFMMMLTVDTRQSRFRPMKADLVFSIALVTLLLLPFLSLPTEHLPKIVLFCVLVFWDGAKRCL